MAPGGQPQSIMEIMARTWFIARLRRRIFLLMAEGFDDFFFQKSGIHPFDAEMHFR